MDVNTGKLSSTSGADGRNITGAVFGFPHGRGSTVGSYTLLQMRKNSTLPIAIINERAETIVATGAIMAGLPMVDSVDLLLLRDGDRVKVDGSEGSVELISVEESKVVTCVLVHQGKVLALKRSDKVSTNRGMWAGVSGYIEPGERPIDTAIKEIREEVSVESPRLLKEAPVQSIRVEDRVWRVHPFLFEVDTDLVTLDWEHTEYRWIYPHQASELSAVPGFLRILRSLF